MPPTTDERILITHAKLNEFNHAEEPARVLLERLGWAYVPRESLAEERNNERETLLKGRLQRALLRLNEWMTEEQAERVIFNLEHVDAKGMAPQPDRPRVSDLRHADGRRRTGWATDAHRPILRFRPS